MSVYQPLSPASVIDTGDLKRLSTPSNGISLLYCFNHIVWLTAIALSLVIAVNNQYYFSAFILFILYSTVFNFLSTAGAMHEFCHGRVFSYSRVNKLLFKFLGYLTFVNPALFRITHLNHHRNMLHESDVEGQAGYAEKPSLLRILSLTFPNLRSLVRIFYYNYLTARGVFKSEKLRHIIDKSNRTAEIRKDAVYIFIFHGSVALASLLSQSWLPTLLLSLPNFCGKYLVFVLASSQHNVGVKDQDSFNQISASVSIKLPTLLSALYWNMNYHAEHHLVPSVPHYNLKKLSEKLKNKKQFSVIHNTTNLLDEIKGDYVKR